MKISQKTFLIIGSVLTTTLLFSQGDIASTGATPENAVKLTEEISAFDFVMKGGVFLHHLFCS